MCWPPWTPARREPPTGNDIRRAPTRDAPASEQGRRSPHSVEGWRFIQRRSPAGPVVRMHDGREDRRYRQAHGRGNRSGFQKWRGQPVIADGISARPYRACGRQQHIHHGNGRSSADGSRRRRKALRALPPTRAAGRRSDRLEGSLRRRGLADHGSLRALSRLGGEAPGHPMRRAYGCGRNGLPRQAQHDRVRLLRTGAQPAFRHSGQSQRHPGAPLAGRVVVGFGRRGRRRPDALRHRQRHRWLRAHSGIAERRLRLQDERSRCAFRHR